jgi:hypothetical protein
MQASHVGPVHFEDFDGHQFERLVFAYFLRTIPFARIEWYGQTGNDAGRDIVIEKERDSHPHIYKIVIQCSNRKSTAFKKINDDFKKILSDKNAKPNEFILVAGGKLSTGFRNKVQTLCKEHSIMGQTWSSEEFEERLRNQAEPLLERFVCGEKFPDSPKDIDSLVQRTSPQTDDGIIALMSELFDRPAFYTPFNCESNIPAFRQAITDTIETLNTGIHRLRDGTEIRRIPSRHMVKSKNTQQVLSDIEKKLSQLRFCYDQYIRTGEVRHCGCNNPDCSTFMISPKAARDMDRLRMEILDMVRKIYPTFRVHLGWQ